MNASITYQNACRILTWILVPDTADRAGRNENNPRLRGRQHITEQVDQIMLGCYLFIPGLAKLLIIVY